MNDGYGDEIWCNLEGDHVSIVKDFTGMAGYDITICELDIMGEEMVLEPPTANHGTTSVTHYYEGPTTLATSFTVDRDLPIFYSCTSSEAIDLCSSSAVEFDSHSGVWTLSTQDKEAYPPGIYQMTITAAYERYPQTSTSTDFTIELFTIELDELCENATLTEGTYEPVSVAYDLASPISAEIPLPTTKTSPSGCPILWKLYRASDNADMMAIDPPVFAVLFTSLLVRVDATLDPSLRDELFGAESYYLMGTLQN